jgi:hypothetical protein
MTNRKLTKIVSNASVAALVRAKETAEREVADCRQWVADSQNDFIKAKTSLAEAESNLQQLMDDLASLQVEPGDAKT